MNERSRKRGSDGGGWWGEKEREREGNDRNSTRGEEEVRRGEEGVTEHCFSRAQGRTKAPLCAALRE